MFGSEHYTQNPANEHYRDFTPTTAGYGSDTGHLAR
jgi:hypothetical protein